LVPSPAPSGRSVAGARVFCEQFFSDYNREHRNSGIGLHTPVSVDRGTAIEIRAQRVVTLNVAHAASAGSATAAHHRRSCRQRRGSNKPTMESDAQKNG
jgi:hypothetical protein